MYEIDPSKGYWYNAGYRAGLINLKYLINNLDILLNIPESCEQYRQGYAQAQIHKMLLQGDPHEDEQSTN